MKSEDGRSEGSEDGRGDIVKSEEGVLVIVQM